MRNISASVRVIMCVKFSVTTNTLFANKFIILQLVSTLGSSLHQVEIQECEQMQELKTIK